MPDKKIILALNKAINAISLNADDKKALLELKHQLENTNDVELIIQLLTTIIRLIGITSSFQDL